jgi:hypothetical protein
MPKIFVPRGKHHERAVVIGEEIIECMIEV